MGGFMKMADIDSIVFQGHSSQYTHMTINNQEVSLETEPKSQFANSISAFKMYEGRADSESYFAFGDLSTLPMSSVGGIRIDIDGTNSYDIKGRSEINEIYDTLLDEYKRLTVEPRNNPSCMGCPMGCDFSSQGEDGQNRGALSRCLVSCAYAEDLYKEIPLVYSCLNSVGYNYHHSHLEKLPELVGDMLAKIDDAINSELETK